MSSVWKSKRWIAASSETLHPGRQILLGIEQWIFRERSDYQEVVIARVPGYGIGLFLDGLVQVLAHDEFVYHEAFGITPLLYHPNPRRVLIEGGGDGLALREVLRDPRVEQVVMVELDPVVIRACREHLSELHQGSFDDPRADIRVGDALAFLEETDQTFDVILIDLIDAYDTPSLELYQRALPLTKKALSKGGIVSSFGDLSGTPCSAAHNFRALSRQFDNVATHLAAVETFGGSYAFFLASNDVDFDVAYEREDEVESSIRSRARALKGGLRSLVPDAFPRCFRLPPYINERIETRLDASFREELAEHVEWIYPESTEDDRGAHEGVEGTR